MVIPAKRKKKSEVNYDDKYKDNDDDHDDCSNDVNNKYRLERKHWTEKLKRKL